MNKIELINLLDQRLGGQDVRVICMSMGMDRENFASSKRGAIMDIVEAAARQYMMPELLSAISTHRSDIQFSSQDLADAVAIVSKVVPVGGTVLKQASIRDEEKDAIVQALAGDTATSAAVRAALIFLVNNS